MVIRMSGFHKINDIIYSVCTGSIASVCAVTDEKMSEQVENEILYEVANFLVFALTTAGTNCDDDNFRLCFRATCLRNTMVNIVKGMEPYVNTKNNRTVEKSTSGWMNWIARTNERAGYVNPKQVGQRRVPQ